jgi:V8-like Glu-specific endopeptidase
MTTTDSTVEREWVTADLNVAALIITNGHCAREYRPQGRQCVFVFGPEVAPEAERYYRNEYVPARAYAATLRDLKAVIAQLRNTHTTLSRKGESHAAVYRHP